MATLHTDPVTRQETFTGYSWTTLFFGPFPAMFRQDWVGVLIGLGIILGLLVVTAAMDLVTTQMVSIVVWAIWAAVYNSSHASRVS